MNNQSGGFLTFGNFSLKNRNRLRKQRKKRIGTKLQPSSDSGSVARWAIENFCLPLVELEPFRKVFEKYIAVHN